MANKTDSKTPNCVSTKTMVFCESGLCPQKPTEVDFPNWLESELEKLELRHISFWTPRSLRKSIRQELDRE